MTKEERKEYMRKYRQKYKEKFKEKDHKYYQEHREELRNYHKQYGRKYRQEHKEKIKEKDRRYYQEHKESINNNRRKYRQEHKEELCNYLHNYYKINKSALRKKANQKRKDTLAEFKIMLGGKCAHCGTTENLQFHHVDKSTKKFNIAARVSSTAKCVLKELKKCILLCGTCHRALHTKLRREEKERKRAEQDKQDTSK